MENKKLICPVKSIKKNVVKRIRKDIVQRLESTEQNEQNLVLVDNSVSTVTKSQMMPNPKNVEQFTRRNEEKGQNMKNFSYMNHTLFTTDDKGNCLEIGNFWIEIVAEEVHRIPLVNEQNVQYGCDESSMWKLKIHCCNQTFHVTMARNDLVNQTKLFKATRDLAHLEEGKEPKRYLQKYFQNLIQEADYRREYLYPSTGWIKINGEWKYLFRSGEIGNIGSGYRAEVEYDFSYNPQMVGDIRTFQEFVNLRNMCPNKRENAVFLMHYTCLATMTTLFQEAGYPIKFILALIGTTNSLKTSVGIIFSRMFDRTVTAMPDIRFDSTEGALLEKMESYGDAILMIDDLLPHSDNSLRKAQLKKSETVARGYGDRVPRKRSKAYAKINQVAEYSPVRGCCLITGEMLDVAHESTATRVIQASFDRGDVDKKLLTYYQENLLNVPTFLYDFISFVGDNANMIFQIIKNYVGQARINDLGEISIPRYREVYGIMQAETDIFYQYAIMRGFMTVDDAEAARNTDLSYILKLILQNQISNKKQSVASMICQALEWGIQKEKIDMISIEMARKLSKETVQGNKYLNHVVVDEEEYIGILPQTMLEVCRDYFKEIGENIRFRNTMEISTALKKEDALLEKVEGSKKRYTHKISYANGNRVYLLKKTVFGKLCESFE